MPSSRLARRRLTEADKAYIVEHSSRVPLNEIAARLGRSYASVWRYARYHCLTTVHRVTSKSEVAAIVERLFPHHTALEIAICLRGRVPLTSIRYIARLLGLKSTEDKRRRARTRSYHDWARRAKLSIKELAALRNLQY